MEEFTIAVDIREEYREWLKSRVKGTEGSYKRLLDFLFEKEFVYVMVEDSNRYADAISLRSEYTMYYAPVIFTGNLDLPFANILEVMVALAIRCETDTMCAPEFGDRTYIWFWDMIRSLGLIGFTDEKFSTLAVNDILDRFLERTYSSNGHGGLVTDKTNTIYMPAVSIWDQMIVYMNQYLAN